MENIDETINTVKQNTFVSHVFNFDEDTKNELTNMVQYLLLAIIPVVMLNKIMENVIPQYDENKGNIELLVEVVGHVSLTVLAIFLIHRIITFIPTYSKTDHKPVSMMTILVVLLLINNDVRAKLNLLFDRVNSMVGNKKETYTNVKEGNEGKNKVNVNQPIQGTRGAMPPLPEATHQPSQSDDYLQQRDPPSVPDMRQETGHNNLAEGFGSFSGDMGPVAANSGLGAFSGF